MHSPGVGGLGSMTRPIPLLIVVIAALLLC
jgi:hypothetical protein